jgi:hypothetical protein
MDFKKVVETFEARDFRPSSLFQRNHHWQTIVGSGAVVSKLFGVGKRPFSTFSELINTTDGDVFEVLSQRVCHYVFVMNTYYDICRLSTLQTYRTIVML